jgi:membrane protein DedA with SNARE-associated domain
MNALDRPDDDIDNIDELDDIVDIDPVEPVDDTSPVVPGSTVEHKRPSGRTLSLIVTPIIVLVIAGWVGDASAAYLVDHHPLWLITLNARNRNLLLVTNHVDALPYYTIGTLRLLLSDPLFYLLGVLYGDAAIKWMERKAPTYGKLMRSAERFFAIAAYPLVFLAPNNYICLFAGAAGMPIPVFLVLNLSGTLARLYVLRVTGDIFQKPIDSVIGFIQDYRVPIIVASVLLVAFTIWNERRQGGGEIETLRHLEEEMGRTDDSGSASS